MSASAAQPPGKSPSKRIEFIDLLRGWAVIVMIETHVFNATLTPDASGTGFFQYLKFINGLVAPSFLFASGLAYAVTTRRKLHDYLSFGAPLFKQFGRLLFILALGYLLHLPKFNFAQIVALEDEHPWRVFFQADILQCIAVSLLVMQMILLIVRSERRLYAVLTVVAVVVPFLSPVVWSIDFWPLLPAPVAGYMNGIHFANFPGFPLFPWSAFLFAGAITGYFYQESRGSLETEIRMMKRMLIWATGIFLASLVIQPAAESVYGSHDYWLSGPSFVLLRLALVMGLCAAMFLYEKKKGVKATSVVTLIGRESLFVYVGHLLLIYGDFASFNFSKYIHHSFGFGEAAVATVLLFLLMSVLAYGWGRVKRESYRWKMILQYGALLLLIGVFFFGPGE